MTCPSTLSVVAQVFFRLSEVGFFCVEKSHLSFISERSHWGCKSNDKIAGLGFLDVFDSDMDPGEKSWKWFASYSPMSMRVG